MKKSFILIFLIIVSLGFSQNSSKDNKKNEYKKRVLDSIEIDFFTSYYSQKGDNAAVTGGIGKEKLSNTAPTIIISIPLNDDDVLVIDAGVSSYTSASSNNLNPFSDPEVIYIYNSSPSDPPIIKNYMSGSPWVESSGASKYEILKSLKVSYSHSSDNRDNIWSGNISMSSEFDYSSFGFGGSYTRLFNEKNTEISIKGNIFLDKWDPQYPIEIRSYIEADNDLNAGFFNKIDILDNKGIAIDKSEENIWSPVKTDLVNNKRRNSFSLSLSFSQIINRNAQFSIFFDIVHQSGWLSSPLQRVYFADRDNFFIGNPSSIDIYTSKENIDVFQLADDIERLPETRFKIPIGMRFNYFLNEYLVLRTYYRYFFDNWGIKSHTANIELPVKITSRFTLYPSYRYYKQTAADYFAPYEKNLSTQEFYTSDYDLSEFISSQYGLGIAYTDIFTSFHIWHIRLKRIELKYNHYKRNTGLRANFITLAFSFIYD